MDPAGERILRKLASPRQRLRRIFDSLIGPEGGGGCSAIRAGAATQEAQVRDSQYFDYKISVLCPIPASGYAWFTKYFN
jgi:hypothetical protein